MIGSIELRQSILSSCMQIVLTEVMLLREDELPRIDWRRLIISSHPLMVLKSLQGLPKLTKIATSMSIEVLLVLITCLVCLSRTQWRHLDSLTPSTHAAADASVDVLILMIV